ncbi:hypothetical protein M413DRAFT_445359 [Hebeloma cylindrosporum]|uniref:Uncharacterized protein n=1 Tax=Hebeloma cylindrosporum TaxID=76867 RepID=A0A0C2XUK1_HEBCY|nr:hypothetical protein M413DRAFT_445359 [Hebeloma cylindrosporum h7]
MALQATTSSNCFKLWVSISVNDQKKRGLLLSTELAMVKFEIVIMPRLEPSHCQGYRASGG